MEEFKTMCFIIVLAEIAILIGALLAYLFDVICKRIAKSKWAQYVFSFDVNKIRKAVDAGESVFDKNVQIENSEKSFKWICKVCNYEDLALDDKDEHICPECFIKSIKTLSNEELVDFISSDNFRCLSNGHSQLIAVHAIGRVLNAMKYNRKDRELEKTMIKTD